MSYRIATIDKIGADEIDALKSAGIRTAEKLLAAAQSPKGRKLLSARTGIDKGKLLRWANKADKLRIKGMGSEYAELLCAAGVDTVTAASMAPAAAMPGSNRFNAFSLNITHFLLGFPPCFQDACRLFLLILGFSQCLNGQSRSLSLVCFHNCARPSGSKIKNEMIITPKSTSSHGSLRSRMPLMM